MLAEGGDAAAVARSIPLTDEILDEAFVAYGQNGEPLRPAHGFPMRLIMPGFEGNLNIKWLRRLKFGDRPWMTRWETARYTQLQANGKATQFQLRMETNSVITSPSGTMVIKPGYQRITGLAWSGHGKIAKVEISTDGAKTGSSAAQSAGAAEGANALPDGLDLGRQADQDRQPLDRRKGQRPARPQVLHRRDGDQRAVSLQRATNLEHRRDREGSQCPRLARHYSPARLRSRSCLAVLAYDFGRPATPDEISSMGYRCQAGRQGTAAGKRNSGARKAGLRRQLRGLPWRNGVGGIKDRLVGGQGTLASDAPVKTVGSFWPYATTLFDYIHRAMPYQAPGSLSNDDTYAVAAYILNLNGILPADGKLDRDSLPKIKMPNRDGFVPDPEFDPAKLFRKK